MTLATTFASIVFTSLGVATLNLLVVLWVNGALRNAQHGFHELETLLAHVFGRALHPTERTTRGLLALFLASWAATLAFILLVQLGVLKLTTESFVLYAIALYLLASLVALPLAGHGVFGCKHHSRAPAWTALLVIVFTSVLAIAFSFLY
jgi:hypothetical protein